MKVTAIGNLCVLIELCTTNAELKKRRIYWQHRLKTFFPNRLHERKESSL